MGFLSKSYGYIKNKAAEFYLENVQHRTYDLMVGAYERLSLFITPVIAEKDDYQYFRNSIDNNIHACIIKDLESLPPEIKRTLFGNANKRVQYDDFNIQLIEKTLMPRAEPCSIFRTFESFDDSTNNSSFRRRDPESYKNRRKRGDLDISYSDTGKDLFIYPKTVTVYENKERARAASALLRVLTAGSGADIFSEKLVIDGKERHVVCDNISKETLEHLMALEKHLARRFTKKERDDFRQEVQSKMDKILTGHTFTDKNEKERQLEWPAWRGYGTWTMACRAPGIKWPKVRELNMFTRVVDARDEKLLSTIGLQDHPDFMDHVRNNESVARDGRYIEPTSKLEKLIVKIFGEENARTITFVNIKMLGSKLYNAFFKGKVDAWQNILKDDIVPTAVEIPQVVSAANKGGLFRLGAAVYGMASKLLNVAISPVASIAYWASKRVSVLTIGWDSVSYANHCLKKSIEETTGHNFDGSHLKEFNDNRPSLHQITKSEKTIIGKDGIPTTVMAFCVKPCKETIIAYEAERQN